MIDSINNVVWAERYRPETVDDFLLSDNLKNLLKQYKEDGNVDNLILYGSTGVGKTSMVRYIINNIECEVLSMNGSDDRGIDDVRDRIRPFVEKNSLFGMKIVDFREGEKLTPDAQDALKDIIEESHDDTRFIFTTNNVSKIIPPIRGRFTEIEVYPSDVQSVGKRMWEIIDNEGITISKEQKKELWKYIKRKYPNIRQIINTIQTSSRSGEFQLIEAETFTEDFNKIIDLLNKSESAESSYKSIRPIINNIPMSLIDEIFSYLYQRSDDIDVGLSKKLDLLNIIAEHNYQSGLVVDKEINVASMIVNISKLIHK